MSEGRASFAAVAALALAGCATVDAAPASGTATLRLGEEARLGGLAVRALRLEEDSRCPLGVQCVLSGTVRLAVRLGQSVRSRQAVLRLGVPEPVGGGRFLWLVAACPVPRHPGPVARSAYSFVVAAAADITGIPPDHFCAPG